MCGLLAIFLTCVIVSTDRFVLKVFPQLLCRLTELVCWFLINFTFMVVIIWKYVLLSLDRLEILRNILERVLICGLRIVLYKTISSYKRLLHTWNHSLWLWKRRLTALIRDNIELIAWLIQIFFIGVKGLLKSWLWVKHLHLLPFKLMIILALIYAHDNRATNRTSAAISLLLISISFKVNDLMLKLLLLQL